MKHVHAELMMQYAQDAMETDKPWERWEYFNGLYWGPLKALGAQPNPSWNKDNQYRRKPNGKVVVIDGQEFIVPKSFKPQKGDVYFDFNVSKNTICEYEHEGRPEDFAAVRSGNCYRTEQEAEQALASWQAINEA